MTAGLLATLFTTGLAALPGSSAGAATSGSGSSATMVLKADILPGLPLLTPATANPEKVLHLGIGLSEPASSAENTYLAGLYNSSSPDYHRFLTPAEFATIRRARSTVEAVQAWLIGGGLAVTETANAGNWIQATGTWVR